MPIGTGTEVDFATGLPVSEATAERLRSDKARYQDLVSRQHGIRAQLRDEQSGIVLQRISTVLADRIDILITQDPECQALIRVLGSFQDELALGRRAAEQLLKPIYEAL